MDGSVPIEQKMTLSVVHKMKSLSLCAVNEKNIISVLQYVKRYHFAEVGKTVRRLCFVS